MPITHLAFLVACLAIAGIPPFAGFFSKEEILFAAWRSHPAIYYLGVLTSGITAFYMFRLYFSIFWNKHPEVAKAGISGEQIHSKSEGTFSMKLPLIFLALGTTTVGFIPFSNFITPDSKGFSSGINIAFSIVPVTVSLIGIVIAYSLYFTQSDRPQQLATALGSLYRTAYRKFYIDEIYLFITRKVIFNCIGKPAAWIDRNIVDGTMNGIAWATGRVSVMIRGLQSGRVQSYAMYFFAGIVLLTIVFIYLWK